MAALSRGHRSNFDWLRFLFYFVSFDSLCPINSLSVIKGWVFLG